MNNGNNGRMWVMYRNSKDRLDAECPPGDPDCIEAALLQPSNLHQFDPAFHDQELNDASRRINDILDSVRPPANSDRELMFLITEKGLLLARVPKVRTKLFNRRDQGRLDQELAR